jgi:glycosyltransferase involved in cell wall biosynthesis
VIEAMMIGMPIVALATTEMSTVIRHGENGLIDTDPGRLVEGMKALIADPGEARRLGEAGRRSAHARFDIARFAADWNRAFLDVAGLSRAAA